VVTTASIRVNTLATLTANREKYSRREVGEITAWGRHGGETSVSGLSMVLWTKYG